MRLPRLFRTSSFRLTLAYAALFVGSVAVLLAVVYVEAHSRAIKTQDKLVAHEMHYLQKAAGGDLPKLQALIEQRVRQPPMKSMRYLLQDDRGHVLAGNVPALAPTTGRFWFDMPRHDKPWKTRRIRARGKIVDHGYYLAVGEAGEAVAGFADLREDLMQAMGYALLLTLLLALAGGALMSQLLLRRVEDIDTRTQGIMLGGHLSGRLPVRGTDDEFDRLATSVNGMLDRIEAQVEAIRQVSDDIAHDLRTPLSRLHQHLERAQHSHDPAQLRTALQRAIHETQAILRTFGALLHIAQIEGSHPSARHRTVDLSELLNTLAEVYLPSLEARRQALHLSIAEGLQVPGDRDLLGQLFANLLENASRHGPEGAPVEFTAAATAGQVVVTIADHGPGIPPEEREKVFRRLYRLDHSRHTPGNGIGLALVAAIAKMHGARIELGDNQPGLRACVTLPPLLAATPERPR